MASVTTTRAPLATLPLSHFTLGIASSSTSSFILPSPTSLPTKRALPPASPSGSTSGRGEGSRKVSRTEKNGSVRASASIASPKTKVIGTGRRESAEITPKIRARLERDDLGLGKSPARRLFVAETVVRSGISGITPAPSSTSDSPFLAPSPPLASPQLGPLASSISASTATSLPLSQVADENGVIRSIHDPGFPIHPDPLTLHTGPGSRTPDSRRTTSLPPLLSATSTSSASSTEEDLFFPPTPSSTSSRLIDPDQENIPPAPGSFFSTPSSSARHSPSKWKSIGVTASGSSSSSRSTTTSGSNSSAYEEEDTVLAVGEMSTGVVMGGKSRNGRSKLAQVILRGRGSSDPLESPMKDMEGEGQGDGEELTPGRRGVDPRGKEKLAKEADEV